MAANGLDDNEAEKYANRLTDEDLVAKLHATPPREICEHGSQRAKCPHCENSQLEAAPYKQWGHEPPRMAEPRIAEPPKKGLMTEAGAEAEKTARQVSDWQPGVLVTGGRDFTPNRAHEAWFKYWLRAVRPAFVLHGGASGVDLWSEAVARGQGIEVRNVPVSDDEWDSLGGAAGPMRNSKLLMAMLEHGGGYCVAFDGGTGTADMLGKAERGGLRVINMQRMHFTEPARQRQLGFD